MNTASELPLVFRSAGFENMQVSPALVDVVGASSKARTKMKYFCGVVPNLQFDKSHSKLVESRRRKLRQRNFVFAHGPDLLGCPRVEYTKWASQLNSLARLNPDRIRTDNTARIAGFDLLGSNLRAKPVVLLKRARDLLSERRVREARDILQHAVASYPEDEQMAGLLRAISASPTRRKRSTKGSRKQEMDWLLEHGRDYRGRWVAIGGDQLVASASTLGELLVHVKRSKYEYDTPLIQKIAAE